MRMTRPHAHGARRPEFDPPREVVEALRAAHSILIGAHKNPDGDCLGSALGLRLALSELGKRAEAYCAGPFLAHFHDFPNIDQVCESIPPRKPFDLTVLLDCGDADRLGDGFPLQGRTIQIDHHASNTRFAEINWVDAQSAATGEMIFRLLRAMDAPIGKAAADALYLALMSDTGGFRFANTSREAFAVASELLEAGASPSEAARLYWENASAESARLRGEALLAMRVEASGRLAWSQLTAEQYARHGGMANEPEGLSAQLRGIRGVEVGALFTEYPDGSVRLSLRSHGAVDVSRLARALGGGGHVAAAGASLKGTLPQARDSALALLREALADGTPDSRSV